MEASIEDTIETNGQMTDPAILKGRDYASPAPGEEVCITGMSGTFPNALNVDQFKEKLFKKVDMVCDEERRWKHFHPEIPRRSGKIYNVQKFDPGFFGIHYQHVESMDPSQRLVLEKAVECIFDAGMHLSELEGTNTGVFISTFHGESEREIFFHGIETRKPYVLGGLTSLTAHRISHYLKLKGPSLIVDTASSSSLHALENAYRHIRDGLCDMAIVGGCNIWLHPFSSLQYARLGVLSMNGICKTFDDGADGFAKSEAVICLLLQKAKNSRRVYAKVVHAKTMCEGFKDTGITFPSREMEKLLLREFYEECQVNPTEIGYVEAHGTGTRAGDPEEGSAIDEIYCKNRKKPLLIGSVKSNIGHCEASAGLASVIKCLIAMEEGHLPPNIHFKTPQREIKGFIEGRMEIVIDKTPLLDTNGLMAINGFGLGGANCHVLLEWNHKVKVNRGSPNDDIPRLVCVSGRTSEATFNLLDSINKHFDAEYIQLLHEIFKENIEGHNHRGYSVVSKTSQIYSSSQRYFQNERLLLIAFGDFGCSWQRIAEHLLDLHFFSKTIQKVHQITINKGLNIFETLTKRTPLIDPVFDKIFGSVILQIGIIELMKILKVKADVVFGYTTGSIACAYFDGNLTLEQAVLGAFEIANHLKNIFKPSLTYLVEFDVHQVLNNMPLDVEIIWKSSHDAVVISGEKEVIKQFVSNLQDVGAKILQLGFKDVILPHRKYARNESSLLQTLRRVIPDEEPRNNLWLSTKKETMFLADYIVKSLYSQVNSMHLTNSISSDTLIMEIGAGIFPELLNYGRNKPLPVVKFQQGNQNNGLVDFLNVLGKLYEVGFNPHIQNLYPKYEYPVSRSTPNISDKIKWEHSNDWHVFKYTGPKRMEYFERTFSVLPKDPEWLYITGHVVDGRNLFPATGYIDLVWETFAGVEKISKNETSVVFENCRLERATKLEDRTDFTVGIKLNSGDFQISQNEVEVASGKIYFLKEDRDQLFLSPLSTKENKEVYIKSEDIYKEFRLRGYHYKNGFKMIQKYNVDLTKAYIKWTGNWVTFIDNMFQLVILHLEDRLLYVPTGFNSIVIDAKEHLEYVESFEDDIIPVYFCKNTGIIRCGGIEIRGLLFSQWTRNKLFQHPVLERYEFVPNQTSLSLAESTRVITQIALENQHGLNVRVVELLDDEQTLDPIGPLIFEVLSDQPLVKADIIILTKSDLQNENVTVEREKTLSSENGCLLVIGCDILRRNTVLNQALQALKADGFILSRQDLDFDLTTNKQLSSSGCEIITVHSAGKEKLILLQKSVATKNPAVVKISSTDEDFNWLNTLQKALKTASNIIIYSQNEDNNGILGLYTCIRKEVPGNNIQCFSIYGEDAPLFDIDNEFYRNQIKKNMSVNIYKDQKWGTYRHLLLEDLEELEYEHCFLDQSITTNSRNLKLIQGPLSSTTEMSSGKTLIQTSFVSICSEHHIKTYGRSNADIRTLDRIQPESVRGFSGYDLSGRRLMGLSGRPLSTVISADNDFLIAIPDKWTMEEAATVPEVYVTVLFALLEKAKIAKGESVLIHAGSEGIGQAAIHVALSQGCNVFTTTTPERREHLRRLFPQLSDRQIGNSSDSTFEILVKKETKGRGVDVVLNSLGEKRLMASLRSLAKSGRFLELGKFDVSNNSKFALFSLQNECSFHTILLEELLHSHTSMKRHVASLLNQGLETGIIKPLIANVFLIEEISEAFHLISSEHNGQVLIQFQKLDLLGIGEKPVPRFRGEPRFYCDSQKSYVILGGLGGFGLEVVDWLIKRGAKNLIISSRKFMQTGYQIYRMRIWKSQGVNLKIITVDVSTRKGCEKLIDEAEKLGTIDAVFNFAAVLLDSILENQTAEYFKTCFGPKVNATNYMDEITRKRCPQLRHFVVCSSASCGRGCTGQTNYGMANSAAERICEKRRKSGYPGLAIELGVIADVGLVANMQKDNDEMDVDGLLQQKIPSCLKVLDMFLCQKKSTIVSSMILADKKVSRHSDNIAEAVANVLGIKCNVASPHATLAEFGMDSITAVEIKQIFERKFGIFQSLQQIRGLTFIGLTLIMDINKT